MIHVQVRGHARRADVLPPEEEREGPEPERLEHADLERRPPHPKSPARRAEFGGGRAGDRLNRH